MNCKKCTYFKKVKNLARGGTVVVGFCELRQKHISDETIRMEHCKDRAILTVSEKEATKGESEDEFVKRVVFG